MIKRKTLPKGILLGIVKYGNSKIRIYNIGGKAMSCAKSQSKLYINRTGNKYICSYKHIGMGYMLRKLGIESNTGGQIFKHYSINRKTFRGLNRNQIIKLQKGGIKNGIIKKI